MHLSRRNLAPHLYHPFRGCGVYYVGDGQAQATVINLADESTSLQQSIQNRCSALLQQEVADEKTAAQKAKAASV